jgi:hypothetical protein
MITPSLTELDQAWAARLEADTNFAAAIGVDANNEVRLYRGWPHELLAKPAEDNLPRGTWFRVDQQPLTENPELLLIQSDLWVWRNQLAQLYAASNAMMVALTDRRGGAATWFDATLGIHVSSRLVDSNDPQEEFFIRRRHLWEIAPAWG